MLPDIIGQTIELIKERARNPFQEKNSMPFAGAFLIALVIFNWQLFFSLFTFDETDTRIEKIKILNQFLSETKWFIRIGYPVLIAFGSILFYYFFSHISLGITTFFNRWFKATILYFTDRSKIISRDELNTLMHKMSNLRTKYEDLFKRFSESLSEIDDYKQKISEIEIKLNEESTSYSALLESKKKIEKENLKLQAFINESRILYARYGKNDNYIDVTKKITTLFSNQPNFHVTNEVLEGDPIVNTLKEITIIYQFLQRIYTITATEGDELILIDGQIKVAEKPEPEMKKGNAIIEKKTSRRL